MSVYLPPYTLVYVLFLIHLQNGIKIEQKRTVFLENSILFVQYLVCVDFIKKLYNGCFFDCDFSNCDPLELIINSDPFSGIENVRIK